MKLLKFLLLALVPAWANAQTTGFRTDGYYYHDNGIDTVYVIPMNNYSGRVWFEGALAPVGAKMTAADPCIPDSTIPTKNSSKVQVLAFFSNTSGLMFSQNCWNAQVKKQLLDEIKEEKEKFDKNVFLEEDIRARINKDNTFVLSLSPSGEKIQQVIRGKIFRDMLVVYGISYLGMPKIFQDQLVGYLKFPLTFKFYKNGEAPPVKKVIISYVAPLEGE